MSSLNTLNYFYISIGYQMSIELTGTIAIIFFMGAFFYIFNELEDACVRNKFKNKSQWWNTGMSWKNKYKLDSNGGLLPYEKKWYHFGFSPKYEERFPFSTTFLVFLTDGEHFFQFLKFKVIELIIIGFCFILYQVLADIKVWFLLLGYSIGETFSKLLKEKYLKFID